MTSDPKFEAHRQLVSRLLSGPGRTSPSERRLAFDGAWASDEELRQALPDGRPEEEIFELVICAAVGAATRQYEAGLAALADAT